MLRNILYAILTVSTLWSISACDEIDGPYGNQVEIEEPTELTRKAVVFEFTGIHCTNCPLGHQALDRIDSVYHGHVIPISVHAGYFAEPYPDEPEFRTYFGNELYENLGSPLTPSVIIGSMNADNVIVGGSATWQGAVGNVIPAYTKVIVSPEVDLEGSEIKAKYNLQLRKTVANSLLFYAFVVEDSIAGPQLGTDIDPYYHRHVLRKSMGNMMGNRVNFVDDKATISFSSSVQSGWDIENVSVVGIIVDSQTKEIYTGEVVKLISD